MLVETDSDAKADANSEACLLEIDSDLLTETDSELKTDSEALLETDSEVKTDLDRLAEIDALASEALIDDEVDTLIDSEINSDTEAD